MPVQTSGHFTYDDWQEQSLTAQDASPRLSRASVANTFTGGIEAAGTACAYTNVYLTPETGSFTGLEVFTGTLDGRRGSFVAEERGVFGADGTVHCTFEVVAGSGTGELAGLRGTGSFTHRQGGTTVPYTFTYELD
ncbi:DUF3224 domain-containing protein [Streptomyces antimicrobicus]|uniref:DUF3224 domain-containing protein n=1 Tax=Streptomyces antimicrobicus TaxID=2883108 RepID=A0ABS8BB01_9ACTN|nr:DUF3224 domain-containing protein [Streptomyces antimicrobicus]MCB5181813.1 DUF3224 domain-containing protein [Streptomyces antimicrobicus]